MIYRPALDLLYPNSSHYMTSLLNSFFKNTYTFLDRLLSLYAITFLNNSNLWKLFVFLPTGKSDSNATSSKHGKNVFYIYNK